MPLIHALQRSAMCITQELVTFFSPSGRHVDSTCNDTNPQAPVALNPDLSGRGDMCPSESSQFVNYPQ